VQKGMTALTFKGRFKLNGKTVFSLIDRFILRTAGLESKDRISL
jgi:hypothetical protein